MRDGMDGHFLVGSFNLNPIEHATKIKSNIISIEKPPYTEHEYQLLPRLFIDEKLVRQNLKVNLSEKNYLDSNNIINKKSIYWNKASLG